MVIDQTAVSIAAIVSGAVVIVALAGFLAIVIVRRRW